MKTRAILGLLLGLLLVTAGSLIWRTRYTYSPEQYLEQRLRNLLLEVPAKATVDLSESCKEATERGGWIIFVLNTSITNDGQVRTFFETAEEPLGLYVEYEPAIFRLGLGMGPGNVNQDGEAISSTQLPIRRVHRDENIQVFIGVTEDLTRLVTNTRDETIAWPGYLADEWKCNAVRIADDTRAGTEGNTCSGCNAQLRYATGRDLDEFDEILDAVSNIRQYNIRRLMGSALTFLGIACVFISMGGSSLRRKSRQTES